ncbi:MAG: hypothetical protein ACE5GS_17725 [Kiloniellaceae bacterium]
MVAWPASLPQDKLLAAVQETAPDLVVRTQMDAGPAKVRRRFTAGVRPFEMELDLTLSEVQTLDDFFVTTLAGGALAFDWQHPRTGATLSFRFVAPPSYVQNKGAWSVSLRIEALP